MESLCFRSLMIHRVFPCMLLDLVFNRTDLSMQVNTSKRASFLLSKMNFFQVSKSKLLINWARKPFSENYSQLIWLKNTLPEVHFIFK